MKQFFTPQNLTEKMAYITVQIKTNTGTGTGFLYQVNRNNGSAIFLITNKHVVKDASSGTIMMHGADADGNLSGELHNIEISAKFEESWIFHNDQNVDLCALPLGYFIDNIWKTINKKLYLICLDETLIPSEQQLEDLSYAEDVMMVGYPTGLSDTVNNYPIIRKGITATHPCINFKEKNEFVVDMACFPGSSGSPILLINEGMYQKKSGGTVFGNRAYFLGVLYAGPQYSSTGEVHIQTIPTNVKLIPDIKNMMHLGYVIKSSEVKKLVEQIMAMVT